MVVREEVRGAGGGFGWSLLGFLLKSVAAVIPGNGCWLSKW